MFGKYKIIVSARLESGDSITASTQREGTCFKKEDLYKILDGVNSRILPHEQDVLYYTIRVVVAGKKDNFKLKTYTETYKKVEELLGNG